MHWLAEIYAALFSRSNSRTFFVVELPLEAYYIIQNQSNKEKCQAIQFKKMN